MGRDLEPLADRMVVRVVKDPEVTAGGVVLPDSARERSQRGVVLAVGPGIVAPHGERVPVDVAAGDVVLFSKYGGTELPEGHEDLLVLREADVLCKERQVDGPGMTERAEAGPTYEDFERAAHERSTDREADMAREGYSPVLTEENERRGRELELRDALTGAFDGVEGHVDVEVTREEGSDVASVVVSDGEGHFGGEVGLSAPGLDVAAQSLRDAWDRRDEFPREEADEATEAGDQ